jgi:hypothetical protein
LESGDAVGIVFEDVDHLRSLFCTTKLRGLQSRRLVLID